MRARLTLLLVLAALAGSCGDSDNGASDKSGGPEATKTPEKSGPGAY